MPNQTVPDNATPAATSGADQSSIDVGSLDALAAFIATNEAGPTETDSDNKPAAVEADNAPSQLETASDGAEAEAESPESKDEGQASEEASAEEQAEPKDDADKTDDEVVEGLPRRARKRIDTLTARNKQLEAEMAELRAKQPKVEAKVSESAPVVIENQLDHISDLRELEGVEAKSRNTLRAAERALDMADELRDQLDVDPETVLRHLKAAKYDPPEDRDGMARFLGELKREIRAERAKAAASLDAVPRRRSHLEQEARVVEAAAVDYPWLKDRESEEYAMFEQIIRARPTVKQMGPDWPFVVAVQMEGIKSLNARRAAKAKAAPVLAKAAAAPPKQPNRSVAPRPAAGSAARSRFEETGSVEDLTAAIAAGL
jgi:hypothetical protein